MKTTDQITAVPIIDRKLTIRKLISASPHKKKNGHASRLNTGELPAATEAHQPSSNILEKDLKKINSSA